MPIRRMPIGASLKEMSDVLSSDGCLVIENAIPPATIDTIRLDLSPHFASCDFGDGIFCGFRTKRLGGIPVKSAAAWALVAKPEIVQLMEAALGPYCDRIQLNLTQAITIYPGEREQILHRDDGMFPAHGFIGELMANIVWALDDIGPEHGATRIVPGSHKWDRNRAPEPGEVEQPTLNRGSAFVYFGSTIHSGGANRSTKERPIAVVGYNLGWLRQAEVAYLVYPPEVARRLPEPVQRLIGYAVHRPNCGMVDCDDPIRLLRSQPRDRYSSHDFVSDEHRKLMEQVWYATG